MSIINYKSNNFKSFLMLQGRLLSTIGDRFFLLGLGFSLLEQTKSPITLSIVLATITFVKVLFSTIAGNYINRCKPGLLLVISDIGMALSIALFALLTTLSIESHIIYILIAIATGIASSFFGIEYRTLIHEIIPKKNLIKFNSTNSLTIRIGTIAGNAIAGLLYTTLGAVWLFILNSLSFVLSAITEIPLINSKERKVKRRKTKLEKNSWKLVYSIPMIRNQIFLIGILRFLHSIFGIILIADFSNNASLGPGSYGLSMGLTAVGSSIGYTLLTIFDVGDKQYKIYSISIIIFSLSIFGIGMSDSTQVILPMMLIMGLTFSLVNILNRTLFQYIIPSENRAIFYGVIGASLESTSTIGLLVGGFIVAMIQPGVAISGIGIIMLCTFFIIVGRKKIFNEIKIAFLNNA